MRPGVEIVSYPRTGFHWINGLISHVLVSRFDLGQTYLKGKPRVPIHDVLAEKTNGKALRFGHTHDEGASSNLKWQQLSKDKSGWSNKKVMFLIRDPRDTIVSSYWHHYRKDLPVKLEPDESISQFIRRDTVGVKKLLRFWEIWSQNQHVPLEFHLQRYEDMHEDGGARAVRKLAEMINVEVDDSDIVYAVEAMEFSKQQKLEGEMFFRGFRSTKVSNKETYIFRRGKMGGYGDYLSQEDIEYINSEAKQTEEITGWKLLY